MGEYLYQELTQQIIGAAMEVHNYLGPGMLESAYRECLYYELNKRNIFIEREVPVPVIYKEIKLECEYRIDLLVERKVVVELKSIEAISDVHEAQVLTYLKFSGCRLGLLINFNVKHLRDGIRRFIL